jgi:hypothetical protein
VPESNDEAADSRGEQLPHAPNVVVDQSFAWITVDDRSVAIERG